MERSLRNGSGSHRDDNSLGILNMDNLKGRGRFFGELSTDSFTNGSNESDRLISDRLNSQRLKALEALHKSQKGDVFKKPQSVINKENLKGVINASSTKPREHDRSDYVPFRRPHAINISDLVTDETINLETSSCPPSASKDVKVSFEPAEITGRSTLYKRDQKTRNNMGGGAGDGVRFPKAHQSVSDILASSFASKARNLCDTLQGGDTTLDSSALVTGGRHIHGISSVSSSTACSSFTSYNRSKSLPRTADMSLSKNTCTEESFNGCFENFSFSSDGAGAGVNGSGISNEEFEPGELMQSKLINDEISWAQEYAAIPAATLSEQAKAKAARTSAVNVMFNGFDSPSPSASNSMIAGDPNFSVGNFFNMRSDNIWNIVNSRSPDKCRTPVALVGDECNNTVTTTTSEVEIATNVSITPKIDNKTYTRVGAASIQKPIETSTSSNRHESKDSGNSTENSYLLSMSAIDRALCNLDIEPDASGVGLQQLLMHGKKSKSCMNPYREVNGADNTIELASRSKDGSLGAEIKLRANVKSDADADKILENKENLDPEAIRRSSNIDLSDTMSFTESLLNSSDMKQLQRNITLPRSPLSPIEVSAAPKLRVSGSELLNDGEEADNDEWPGTPITRNRQSRRTKSPRDCCVPQFNTDAEDSPDAITPVNTKSFRSHVSNNINLKGQKSMSSTRLDGCTGNVKADCNIAVSPNISNGHLSASSLVVRSNTLAVPQISVQPDSPARLDSSPRNYRISYVSSPTPSECVQRSTDLDATTNSDRQQLSADTARKVVSSPVGSETSSSCSYGTMQTYRSAISSTSARSVSRCSSSSEFSHRDGKQIPLKVTNTELSWGSVKLRSDSRKSMQIKNIINKRLVIRIEVSGPGYQIVNSQRSNTVTLQSQECRSISISFCPTMRGVAIGKLSFYAPTGGSTIGNSFLDVPLYGYGGNASVIAQNIIIGPVGNPFVTMGNVCELAQPLERTVSFFNKGPLLAFAVINVDSIGLMMPRLSDAFEIYPRKMLIPPKSVVNVRVVFRPKREEIKKLIKKMSSVLTLANMRVICGDEPNRQRIRRLLVQMSKGERSKLSSPILDMLWTKFPEELELQDLDAVRENPSVAMELTSGFRIHDITLTINYENMDETSEASSLYLPDVDETLLFHTVCHVDSPTPPSTLGTVDEMFEECGGADEHVTSTRQGSWSVTPAAIDINLNHPEMHSLFVHNGFKSRQYFEVSCNKNQTLCFAPSEGYVAPDDGRTKIDVGIHTNFQIPSGDVYITVYMENERITVPVKFHHQ